MPLEQVPEQQAPQLLSSLPLQVLAPAQVQEQVQEQVPALVEVLAQVQEQVQALALEQAQDPIELAAMPSIRQHVLELAVPEASAERRVLALAPALAQVLVPVLEQPQVREQALVLAPERVMGSGFWVLAQPQVLEPRPPQRVLVQVPAVASVGTQADTYPFHPVAG